MTFPVSAAEFTLASPNSIDSGHLQRLLDAAAETILLYMGDFIAVSGTDDQINEILTPRGAGPLLWLSRRALTVDEVIEGETTLAADDYELRSLGHVLRRLDDGTNPASYWLDRVYVTYTPLSDEALREMVQIELVKLDVAFNPTLSSQTIGSWSETYQQGKPYPDQRADLLASLHPGSVAVW